MSELSDDDETNWWCDYCQRGKTGYPRLPTDCGITDTGGQLICDDCNAPTVTAVGLFEYDSKSVWLYYRGQRPPDTEMIHRTKAPKQHELLFEQSVDVPTATDKIEQYSDRESIILMPPFDE